MTTLKLDVEGMSCSHCENAVKKAAGALAGVKSVTASAAKKAVEVIFDGGLQTRENIIKAVEEQDFEVKGFSEN